MPAASPFCGGTRSPAWSRAATSCMLSASRRPGTSRLAGPDVRERLLALPGLERVFEAVQAVGESFEGVYLVGGAVRDLLMDEPSFDVDIAVEGDGIAFGRALAVALGGRVVSHDKFGTAVGPARRRTRRRRDGAHRVLRLPGSTARRRAGFDSRGSLPARLHDQRARSLAEGRGFRPARGLLRRPARPRGGRRSRAPQPLVHRRSRRASSGRFATRIATASGWRRTRRASRAPASRWSSSASSPRPGCATSSRRCSRRTRWPGRFGASESSGWTRQSTRTWPRTRRRSHSSPSWTTLRRRFAPEAPVWRPRLAVLARRLPPDELYGWFERLRLRRRDADRIADAVTVAPRLRELVADDGRARRAPRPRRAARPRRRPAGHGRVERGCARAPRALLRGAPRTSGSRSRARDLAELGLGESPQVGRRARRGAAPQAERGARRARRRARRCARADRAPTTAWASRPSSISRRSCS